MVWMEERGARGVAAAVALGLALVCAPVAGAQSGGDPPAGEAAVAADTTAPAGAVGGVRDPAAGILELTVRATDDGAGLSVATGSLGGRVLDTARFDSGGCCPAVGEVRLRVPTALVADGPQRLVVQVTDGAGNAAKLVDQVVTVINTPPLHQPIVTVVVGSRGGGPSPSPGPGGSPPPAPGFRCRAPRLSMTLAQRPVRYRRGVPVLAAGRRYRFHGQLTCLIDGRRVVAPRGTLVRVRSRRPGRTFVKPSVRVGGKGRVVARLAFRTSRSVSFSVRPATVRIRFHVVRLRGGRA